MQFRLTIDCDNAAFGDGQDPTQEIKRILKRLVVGTEMYLNPSDKRYGANQGKLFDGNGNAVGSYELVTDE